MHLPERRRFLRTCAALGAGAAPWGCGLMGPYTLPGYTAPKNETDFAEAINAFSLDLFHRVATERGNIVVSPFSVETALAMATVGAQTLTATEMKSVLHFYERPLESGTIDPMGEVNGGFQKLLKHLHGTNNVELNIANAVWGEQTTPWRKEYLRKLDEYYGGGFIPTDFRRPDKACEQVNRWVAKQTNDKIRNLLDESNITTDTRMVLANAIYFHGKWSKPFKKSDTINEQFHSGRKNHHAEMMKQTGKFGYFQGEGFQALELPYRGEQFSMIVLLPKENDGLSAFEKQLTAEQFRTACDKLANSTEVNVKLPRFKIEKAFDLVPALKEMGIRTAFTNQADFSGMHSGKEMLKIDAVQHKAFIDVAEEGTEAAAATAVTMTLFKSATPVEPPIPNFHADHPFLYAIRHRPSGAILFIGRVEYPG